MTAYLREILGLVLLLGAVACGAAAVGLATNPAIGLGVAAVALGALGVALTVPSKPAATVAELEQVAAEAVPLRSDLIA